MNHLASQTAAEIAGRHPCFCEEAHDRVGRVHLPVAPRCSIQCNFCERRMCAEVQHPGWTARLLSTREARDLVAGIAAAASMPELVIGVAGPGDALANDESLEVLGEIRARYPRAITCLCTNGLLLEEKVPAMVAAGVSALTVTVNAADTGVGKEIYAWVRDGGTTYRGEEAAALLIAKQFAGLAAALSAGLALKVNTVLIPGVNDRHLPALARRLRDSGVKLMNVVPLIPAGRMRGYRAPSAQELWEARRDCAAVMPQFHRCEQCRADVVFLPR